MNRNPFASDRPDAAEPRPLGEGPPGWEAKPFATTIDGRVDEMRALLRKMRPASDAEALRALRSAFPEASLAARVAAMSGPDDPR